MERFSDRMDEIAAECVRTIAQAKGVPPESITPDTTLESLALDSLDRVTLSFDLEEHYRIQIPEHVLLSMQTVGDVANAVREAKAKREHTATLHDPAVAPTSRSGGGPENA